MPGMEDNSTDREMLNDIVSQGLAEFVPNYAPPPPRANQEWKDKMGGFAAASSMMGDQGGDSRDLCRAKVDWREWKCARDTETGEWYYYHATSLVASWEKPPGWKDLDTVATVDEGARLEAMLRRRG